MRLKIGALTVSALSVALVASGCSETKNESGGGDAKTNVQAGAISYDANDNKAPAPAVEGAAKGGTAGVMVPDGFEHLDPARNYVNTQQLTGQLLYRTLNALPVPYLDPDDISNAVLFLASDEARFITEVALPVDAGYAVK